MGNILRNLYYGKLIPGERRRRDNEKQREIVQKIDEEEKYFTGKMSPDDCTRFGDLSDLYSELAESEEYESFAYGFSLGALLIMNMLDEADILKSGQNHSM